MFQRQGIASSLCDSLPDGIDFVGDTAFDAVFYEGGFGLHPNDITDVGVLSPCGTVGQGGNVMEWEETDIDLVNDSVSSARAHRGGNWGSDNTTLLSSFRSGNGPAAEFFHLGFRVASVIPEPTTSALALVALCLAMSRRRSLATKPTPEFSITKFCIGKYERLKWTSIPRSSIPESTRR